MPISLEETQHKTQSLFEMAKGRLVDITEKEEKETFKASNGWWDKFSTREGLGSVKLLGEAASADIEAAKNYPNELRTIIGKSNFYLKFSPPDGVF